MNACGPVNGLSKIVFMQKRKRGEVEDGKEGRRRYTRGQVAMEEEREAKVLMDRLDSMPACVRGWMDAMEKEGMVELPLLTRQVHRSTQEKLEHCADIAVKATHPSDKKAHYTERVGYRIPLSSITTSITTHGGREGEISREILQAYITPAIETVICCYMQCDPYLISASVVVEEGREGRTQRPHRDHGLGARKSICLALLLGKTDKRREDLGPAGTFFLPRSHLLSDDEIGPLDSLSLPKDMVQVKSHAFLFDNGGVHGGPDNSLDLSVRRIFFTFVTSRREDGKVLKGILENFKYTQKDRYPQVKLSNYLGRYGGAVCEKEEDEAACQSRLGNDGKRVVEVDAVVGEGNKETLEDDVTPYCSDIE